MSRSSMALTRTGRPHTGDGRPVSHPADTLAAFEAAAHPPLDIPVCGRIGTLGEQA